MSTRAVVMWLTLVAASLLSACDRSPSVPKPVSTPGAAALAVPMVTSGQG